LTYIVLALMLGTLAKARCKSQAEELEAVRDAGTELAIDVKGCASLTAMAMVCKAHIGDLERACVPLKSEINLRRVSFRQGWT
jgi:hypothetical protein